MLLGHGPIPLVPHVHTSLLRFAERKTGIPEIDDARVQMILVPREYGKSTCVTKTRTLQHILRDANHTVGIANETMLMAKGFLSEIKHVFESNDLIRTLFPETVPPNLHDTVWAADQIVVNRSTKRKEPTVLACGVDRAVTGVHMKEWILDDILSDEAAENAQRGSFTEIEKIKRWMDRLEPLCDGPGTPITLIGCIAHDEPVLMADGTWKPIQDIEVGDMVWARKKSGGEFGPRRVTGFWPQGYADVVEVDVAGRKLVCTPDHPLLGREGRTEGTSPKWKPAEKFVRDNGWDNRGVLLEVFEGMEGIGKTPNFDLYWLCGFLWGDGWVTKCERPNGDITYSVFIAMGEDEELNEKAVRLFVEHFGGKPYSIHQKRSVRIDNTEAGRTLEEWGLTPGVRAPKKRLPRWVFRSRREGKRAFLRGFGDADGYWTTNDRCAFTISSEGLAEDIRLLAMTCNVRPTNLYYQQRTCQPPNSPELVEADCYNVSLNFLYSEEPTSCYGVRSVKKLEMQRPVYDITIEDGDCAFVASGANCGNTPWWEGDCYDYAYDLWGERDDHGRVVGREFDWTVELPNGETQHITLVRTGDLAIYARPVLENGKSTFPEKWPISRIKQVQKNPQLFAANLMLDPSSEDVREFKDKWLRYYHWEVYGKQFRWHDDDGVLRYGLVRDLDCLIAVDPAIAETARADRSAIVVSGTYEGRHHFILEAIAQRLSVLDLSALIGELARRYRPRRVLVETVAYQKALAQILQRDYAGLPIEEVRPGSQKSKEVRIRSIEPYLRGGHVFINNSMIELLHEYAAFPRGRFDDLLDATAYLTTHWSRYANSATPQHVEQKRAADAKRIQALQRWSEGPRRRRERRDFDFS